jgi:hypothetical protein
MNSIGLKMASVCVVGALACATPSVSPTAGKLATGTTPPGPECESLGPVIGKGGGTFGGKWISNDQLSQYAINDAMNKATERGANYLQISTPQLGGGNGTTTTATETAFAFKCPPGANPASAASVPAPSSDAGPSSPPAAH